VDCGRPTHKKVFTGYIRDVRGTTSEGASWIMPGNQLRAYFDLMVVVWLAVEGLGLMGEAARLQGQSPKCQSQATP